MANLFNLFGPSPIKPIEQHMRKVYQCSKQLAGFFDAVIANQWTLAQQIKDKIDLLEHDADALKRMVRLHLPTGLFLPVARTDLLELLNAQDRIANRSKHIAELVVSRQMQIPQDIAALFSMFLQCSLNAINQACQAINELDDLLESGFSGNEVKIVEDMIVVLDNIEHESDGHLSLIRTHIFKMEASFPIIQVIFLYKLVQWIGELADHAQTVGGRLQILIAR